MIIEAKEENLVFFQALASATRMKIIGILDKSPQNIKELSKALGISQAMTTRHIQLMSEAGIVEYENKPALRGQQKLCYLSQSKFEVIIRNVVEEQHQVKKTAQDGNISVCSVPIGHYIAYDVEPTCGLASKNKLIGIVDDKRYFADPEHTGASLLWFGSGWISYLLPNYLQKNQKLVKMEIAFEVCSEAPGFNESWPSDMHFHINDTDLGMWVCPGDFGSKKGRLTPPWYNMGTQYGLLKTVAVDDSGSYIDGEKISDVTLDDLDILQGEPVKFKIENPHDAENRGGVTLFGKNFGNYDKDIELTLFWEK